MRSLPDSSIITILPSDAEILLKAAEQQPLYDDLAYYDPKVPLGLSLAVRDVNPVIFDKVIAAIKAPLSQSPYCVIVRGLRYDDANRLYVALIRALGPIVSLPYKAPRTQFIHRISPTTDKSVRGLVQSERLHTDGADFPEPPAYIAMVCHRPDPMGGGCSRLLALESFRQEIEAHLGPQQLNQVETEAIPWKLPEHLGSGVFWQPILSDNYMRWRRYTIDSALNMLETKLPEETVERLDLMDQIIENSAQTLEFMLQPGDLMVADNLRTLHGRTALSDHPRASERLMYRNWIGSIDSVS